MIRAVALGVFPLLLALFVAFYAADRKAYVRLLKEDGPVENATVLLLVVAAGLAVAKARRLGRSERRCRWCYVAFAAFCVLAALEEVSWGQRILHFASPQFFEKYNRQHETNVHNIIESVTQLTTKDYAAVVFLVYGIGLPIALRRSRRGQELVERFGVVAPPLYLAPGFALATVLQLDFPTGYEEELGELFFSMCAALFMWAALVEPVRASSPVTVRDDARPSSRHAAGGLSWPD